MSYIKYIVLVVLFFAKFGYASDNVAPRLDDDLALRRAFVLATFQADMPSGWVLVKKPEYTYKVTDSHNTVSAHRRSDEDIQQSLAVSRLTINNLVKCGPGGVYEIASFTCSPSKKHWHELEPDEYIIFTNKKMFVKKKSEMERLA